jgi:hypothetical protein
MIAVAIVASAVLLVLAVVGVGFLGAGVDYVGAPTPAAWRYSPQCAGLPRSSLPFPPCVHATCRPWIELATPLAHGGQ